MQVNIDNISDNLLSDLADLFKIFSDSAMSPTLTGPSKSLYIILILVESEKIGY